MKHPSDSSKQTRLEKRLVAQVAKALGASLPAQPLRLFCGASVQVDGVNEKKRVLYEAFSHIGEIKSGQERKLARDLLKLIAVERDRGGKWRKVICVHDQPAVRLLSGRSWLAAVVHDFRFEIFRASASASGRARLVAIQRRQRMVNA